MMDAMARRARARVDTSRGFWFRDRFM